MLLNISLVVTLSTLVSALSIQKSARSAVDKVTSYAKRGSSSCQNTAENRGCWGDGFDINTDTTTTWPNTGNVVKVRIVVLQHLIVANLQ